MIGEGERRRHLFCVLGHPDVNRTHGLSRGVFGGRIRGGEDLIDVAAAAGTFTFVDSDLTEEVRGGDFSCISGGGKSSGVNRLTCSRDIGQASVGRALHVDVESHYVVVREIDRAGASRIDPLAIIAGDQGRHWIGLAESFAAVGGVRAGDSGRQGQTDQGEIGDRREKSGVYRDIYIAPAWGETKVVTTVRQDAAAIRLTEVMEGQRSVSIGRRIQNRGPGCASTPPGTPRILLT